MPRAARLWYCGLGHRDRPPGGNAPDNGVLAAGESPSDSLIRRCRACPVRLEVRPMRAFVWTGIEVLQLPSPSDGHGGCVGGTADCPAAGWIRELASLPRAADPGCSLGVFRPPARVEDLAWYRWIMGHQATFLEWQLLGEVLARTSPVPSTEIVLLLDIYSVLLLYTGSCPPLEYERSIRPRMVRWHPAFSGEWARDYRGIPCALKRAADAPDVREAMRLNRHVHATVAGRLVPQGGSLLREAGRRAGGSPSREELDLYDGFFRTRRAPVCPHAVRAQLLHRLLKIIVDLESAGLYYCGPPVSAVASAGEHIARLERKVVHLLRPCD